MKLFLTINGQEHVLEFAAGQNVSFSLDGVPFPAEIVEVQSSVYSVLIGGRSFAARVDSTSSPQVASSSENAGRNSEEYSVQIDGVCYAVGVRDPRRRVRDKTQFAVAGRHEVKAPMPGKVVRILVAEGRAVEAGQGLIVVEAMKMQNEIKSPKSGGVRKVMVREGQAVNAGETLLIVE